MNTDIRIAVSFLGHRKRKKLRMILGLGATDCLLDLWIQTAMNHPDGVLRGLDEVDIALMAGWDGEPKQFVEAMDKCGFLEFTEEGWKLHDWEEHQPWVIKAEERTAKAKKAADARWAKAEQPSKDAKAMPDACSEHATSIANEQNKECPSPFLSSPCLSSSALSQEHNELDKPKSSCSEPKQVRSEPEPLVCTLPLNDGSEFEVRADFVEQLQGLYRAVDVKEELRRMKGWIIGNPKNRKTRRGITAFITRWLDKEQNKARASPGSLLPTKQPAPGTYAQAQDAERRATAMRILERSKQHGNLADHRGHGGAAIDIAAQLPERT